MEYKEIYIKSWVGANVLKHSKLVVDLYALEDFDEILAKKIVNELGEKIASINRIYANVERLKEIVKKNALYILDELEVVSGDDSFYDYFPDLVDQFKQLCEQAGEEQIYNETIDKINASEQYKEQDEVVFNRI